MVVHYIFWQIFESSHILDFRLEQKNAFTDNNKSVVDITSFLNKTVLKFFEQIFICISQTQIQNKTPGKVSNHLV